MTTLASLLPAPVRHTLSLTRRTHSFRTALALRSHLHGEAQVMLPGCRGPVRFRKGTSDAVLLQAVAFGEMPPEYEHDLPEPPKVILDIGANIGATALLLAQRYPHARIFSFEPLPENARLLKYNTRSLPNVDAFAFGLGSETRDMPYQRSDDPANFGGGGCFAANLRGLDPDQQPGDSVPVVAVPDAFQQLGIDRVDLIKIDTEGAEHDILTSIPDAIMAGVQCIVGELHHKPDDDALLHHLDRWFDLELTSSSGRAQYFRATRRSLGATFRPATSPRAAAFAA